MIAADSVPSNSVQARSISVEKCHHWNVLLAEDSDILRTVIVHSLEDAGCQVFAAPDGDAAWRLAGMELDIDLLITDFKMPGLNGVELARRVRGARPWVPIILISALSTQVRRELRDLDGTIQCLDKPFLSIELVAKVREVLTAR